MSQHRSLVGILIIVALVTALLWLSAWLPGPTPAQSQSNDTGRADRAADTQPGDSAAADGGDDDAAPDARAADADADTENDDAQAGGDEDDDGDSDDESDDEGDGEADDEADDNMVSLAFRGVDMQKISSFLSKRLDKPVIPSEEIEDVELTIVTEKKLPLDEAMLVLHEALRQRGVIIEEHPRVLNLKPIENVQQSLLRLVPAAESLDGIENKALVVRKVFDVEHFDVSRIADAIRPMLPTYGHLVADGNTNQLVITASVGELERIGGVIDQLDVRGAAELERRRFELEHADASWMVSVLRVMLASDEDDLGEAVMSFGGGGDDRGRGRRGRRRGGDDDDGDGTVTIAREAGTVILRPEVTRNWVIAVAPAPVMERIQSLIYEYDTPSDGQDDTETYTIQYANPQEVAQQVQEAVEAIPTMRDSVRVVPFIRSRKLMVYGSQHGQQFVKNLLDDLDQEDASNQITEVIKLEHADAEEVAANIEELFSGRRVDYQSAWGTRYGYDRSGSTSSLHVSADTRRNAVTVVSDKNTLAEIKLLIEEEWDQEVSNENAQPKVYTLKYTDPEQMAELLDNLFSESSGSGGGFYSIIYGSDDSGSAPVGPLLGQFSFQTMPDTDKLVVTTKNPENYEVIDKLIDQLDTPQKAGLPEIVELTHANAEDLAEQLNAMLAQAGTLAEIRRHDRGLTQGEETSTITRILSGESGGQSFSGGGDNNQEQQGSQTGGMPFWWQNARDQEDAQPVSNVVGKIRIVPVYRRNALMVMSPPAYKEPIKQLIQELDAAGQQVIVHAVIAELQHEDTSTLGVRFASDPAVLSDSRLADQAIGINAQQDVNELFGGTFAIGGETFGRGVLNAQINVSALIQLLMREFDLQVISEPKLYTADNQEAEIFEGQDVSVQTDTQVTGEGTVNRGFTYVPVGTRLRVRPHITQDGNVALNINMELSRIVPGQSTFGNPVFDRRETNTRVVVNDGQTVMLSGIVRQQELTDIRKLPLLGDLPLIGGLFRSEERSMQNRELLVFITPQLVSTAADENKEAMEPYRERLRNLRERINGLEGEIPAPEETGDTQNENDGQSEGQSDQQSNAQGNEQDAPANDDDDDNDDEGPGDASAKATVGSAREDE